MNRAQTSPEPGTLLDARVNTVFSASPILCNPKAFQSANLDQVRERETYQGVDVPYPKSAKGNFSIEITGEPPLGRFGYRTLVQNRKSNHIQPFTLPFLRNVVCIRFQREVLLGLPKTNQPAPVSPSQRGKPGDVAEK
jgi:hypothetical protein